MSDELAQIGLSGAAPFIDVSRLEALVERWPSDVSSWKAQAGDYRRAMLRALSVGYFARHASDNCLIEADPERCHRRRRFVGGGG